MIEGTFWGILRLEHLTRRVPKKRKRESFKWIEQQRRPKMEMIQCQGFAIEILKGLKRGNYRTFVKCFYLRSYKVNRQNTSYRYFAAEIWLETTTGGIAATTQSSSTRAQQATSPQYLVWPDIAFRMDTKKTSAKLAFAFSGIFFLIIYIYI